MTPLDVAAEAIAAKLTSPKYDYGDDGEGEYRELDTPADRVGSGMYVHFIAGDGNRSFRSATCAEAAELALVGLAAAGYVLVKRPDSLDAATHHLLPESAWRQHGVLNPDDGAVYDSFDGTREAAERIAPRVPGSRVVVRNHVIGPWVPVSEEEQKDG